MRALGFLLLMVVPALAGCLSGDDATQQSNEVTVIRGENVAVPSGAELGTTAEGAQLKWIDVELPFREIIQIPAGATVVVATAEADSGNTRVSMSDVDTGRRRCNADSLNAWNQGYGSWHQCSGITAVDRPHTEWYVTASGSGLGDVTVTFDARPLGGIAGMLDTSQLSMRDFNITETTGQYVPSFDGVELWVETTLPEGQGPWPTVIAASPYNGQTGRIKDEGGTPAMWTYFTHDWARRGYAIVNVDVRGFGLSGGCVEVWGENEQRDQEFIVDWVAQQPWSDGNVGFYGQSYVGTTPVAAATFAPEALKAIIAVAPVINSYEDWHYGGVPNGENTGSPVAYQVLTDLPGQGTTPDEILLNSVKGVCDPTLVVRANDPRAVYDAFYEERNFKLRAKNVKAATLYTEGFEDSNVKSAMIPGWFNEIEAPKLGVFGHWVHQHPTRADEELLFLGWMDQYVKGRDLGFDALPDAVVSSNVDTVRYDSEWPRTDAQVMELWPDFAEGVLTPEGAADTQAALVIAPANNAQIGDAMGSLPGNPQPEVVAEYDVTEDLAVSGTIHLNVRGTLDSQGNAFLAADLYDVPPDGPASLVTYGMFNLAHNEDHTEYSPVVATASDVQLPFLPTEWVFREGHTVRLVLRAVQAGSDGLTLPGPPGQFTIGAHPDGMGALQFPLVGMDEFIPMPLAAKP